MSYTDQQIEDAYDAMIECALWSSLAYGPTQDDDPIPADQLHDEMDIPDDVRSELRSDIRAFMEDNEMWIEKAGLTPEQVGHDFWLTRERHGTGFWDRGIGDYGQVLTDAAHVYGSVDLQLYYVWPVVEHSTDHRGMVTSTCPECHTQFVYWDEDDLDDQGRLLCYCTPVKGD